MPSRLNNRRLSVPLTLAAAALIAATSTADAAAPQPDSTRASRLDGLVPAGEPVNCLHLNTIRSTHVLDDRTIDFEVGNKIYRNTLPYSCPSLGSEERFLIETRIGQLCSVDTITVLQSFGSGLSRGATCGLGKFQPMMKAPK